MRISLISHHDPDTRMGCHRLYCSAAGSYLKSMRRIKTSFVIKHVWHRVVAHTVITSEVVASC